MEFQGLMLLGSFEILTVKVEYSIIYCKLTMCQACAKHVV